MTIRMQELERPRFTEMEGSLKSDGQCLLRGCGERTCLQIHSGSYKGGLGEKASRGRTRTSLPRCNTPNRFLILALSVHDGSATISPCHGPSYRPCGKFAPRR